MEPELAPFIAIITIIVVTLIVIGYWWRYHSLACPASLSWLVENPYIAAVAGPNKLLSRLRLTQGMKVLDVGSGPGRLTIPAAMIVGETGEVVALDIQSRMLEKLKYKIETTGLNNVRLVCAGAGEGKVDKDYFDRALLVTVLGEIKNKQQALVEIYQALKPGGILSVTELIPDPHYNSISKVRALCEACKFEELESFGNWIVFTINFRKP